ncbi:MAG: hypothetical protein WCD79_12385 [Chthoniobacteraceae bacterium]
MKAIILKFGIFGFYCAGALAVAGGIPDGYPVDRYKSLWEHSPFTIASVQQEVVPAGFASKMALVGIAKIGSEDLVILLNKDSQERLNVGPQANEQGIKLISVEPNSDPLKVCVTIQKGSEVAKVKFDPALLSASAAAPNNPGNIQPQQPVPANQGQIMPPPAGSNPPVVRVRRSLPIPAPYPVQPTSTVPSQGTSQPH